ncbi:MAG: site-specific integrase, partial [Duncaniella sp.]|nr:site-specific integrase [Duncaniella sp.]
VCRQLSTDFRIYASEWDSRHSALSCPSVPDRKPYFDLLHKAIRYDLALLRKIIRNFEGAGITYSADDITNEFRRREKQNTFVGLIGSIIDKLKENGRIRTSETYEATRNSFVNYLRHSSPAPLKREDIRLDCIDTELMEGYEAWLRRRPVTYNTVSFYIRVIRAVYNRAVDRDLIDNIRPFRNVYTGIDKTVKRALPIQMIRRIKALDLSPKPELEYARDMFILSFMLRGMSFIDMSFLKKTDLVDGHISYLRRKTGRRLSVLWTKEMQQIVSKYPTPTSPYLLPIISQPTINERAAYRNKAYSINHNLKQVASMLNLSIPLTLYVARHSWASAAKSKGIPISVISEGMGHESESTTQIYLSSLETTVVDRANALIISSL